MPDEDAADRVPNVKSISLFVPLIRVYGIDLIDELEPIIILQARTYVLCRTRSGGHKAAGYLSLVTTWLASSTSSSILRNLLT